MCTAMKCWKTPGCTNAQRKVAGHLCDLWKYCNEKCRVRYLARHFFVIMYPIRGKRRTEMIYLLLAIVSSTLISVCMRFSEKHIKNNMAMFMANYAVCIVLAKYFMGNISFFVMEEGIGLAVGLGVLCGIFYLVKDADQLFKIS